MNNNDNRINAKKLISSLYTSILFRKPTQIEIKSWINVYRTNGISSLINGIIYSLEANIKSNKLSESQAKEFVISAYDILLKREPDKIGLQGWINTAINYGHKKVLEGIVSSNEFRTLYKSNNYLASKFQNFLTRRKNKLKYIFYNDLLFKIRVFLKSPNKTSIYRSLVISPKWDKSKKDMAYRALACQAPLLSAREFLKKTQLLQDLDGLEQRHLSRPTNTDLKAKNASENHLNRPELSTVYVAETNKALINSFNGLFYCEGNVVHHDMINIKRHKLSEELHQKIFLNRFSYKARWLAGPAVKKISCGASFLDACSANYSHWLTEVLPRINLLCQIKDYHKVPLVIDEQLPQAMLDSLESVAGRSRKIIMVPNQSNLFLQRAVYISQAGYIPWEMRSQPGPDQHGYFNSTALKSLRDKILRDVNLKKSTIKKKLYIFRQSRYRKILNESTLLDELIKKGFVIYNPEKHTFKHQIQTFRDAEIIVAPTGAALANAMFCSSKCSVHVIYGRHRYMPYYYWYNILDGLGIKTYKHVVKDENQNSIHDNFTIDDTTIKKVVSYA